jgi:hypothetical protein
MQLKKDTSKVNISNNTPFDPLLKGKQIYFPDKIFNHGQWYLRTQWDQSFNNNVGIPLKDLEEIN